MARVWISALVRRVTVWARCPQLQLTMWLHWYGAWVARRWAVSRRAWITGSVAWAIILKKNYSQRKQVISPKKQKAPEKVFRGLLLFRESDNVYAERCASKVLGTTFCQVRCLE